MRRYASGGRVLMPLRIFPPVGSGGHREEQSLRPGENPGGPGKGEAREGSAPGLVGSAVTQGGRTAEPRYSGAAFSPSQPCASA